uniref:Uncharacterized protein n=1 Tax=Klebsiella pneumoniae TaxID=573 RepID=A0A8B0SWR9_KLEPN|nr:hypothetical protein [Klebsiella pneumoniae]
MYEKNVWYNKNIINKIECCSVDNLQSLLSIIAAKDEINDLSKK